MIYGSINFGGNPLKSDVLENAGNVLKWNECIPMKFSWGAFTGIFLTNKQSFLNREDVFYADEENDLIVILDGFIYNQEALLAELAFGNGNITGPKIIAFAFAKWGEKFVEQLNGDFAICIYNQKLNHAFFYVDHLGIRPFAVARVGTGIYFSTDVMGLSKGLFSNKNIHRDFLINIFLFGGYKHLLTPVKEVIRILPGHFYKIKDTQEKLQCYWFPERIKIDKNLTEQKVLKDLKDLLIDSVQIRADQRFTASAHISGGLDSGIVAAISRNMYKNQKNFFGFSWSPETTDKNNLPSDERLRVKEICKQHVITPLFSNYQLNDYLKSVSEWRYPSEYVWENKIVEAARKTGINLIFSGWGGDEFISITNRGIDIDLLKALNLKHFIRKFPFWRLSYFIKAVKWELSFNLARIKYSKLKAEPHVYRYLKSVLKTNRLPRNERFLNKSRHAVHLQLIKSYHLAARAADWYVNGQLNGIEYRYPLLDKRIVEYMLKVPSKLLVDGTRSRVIIKKLSAEYFTNDLLKQLSKKDPVNMEAFNKVSSQAITQFMEELEDFRENPDLNFIDFCKLGKDIQKMSVIPDKQKPIPADVFYCIKTAHEFTKGFYNNIKIDQ